MRGKHDSHGHSHGHGHGHGHGQVMLGQQWENSDDRDRNFLNCFGATCRLTVAMMLSRLVLSHEVGSV